MLIRIHSDYIFFTSYMQPALKEGAGLWSNSDELETVNGTCHPAFIHALHADNFKLPS